ncbi:hypothetical protein, partial [Variovorax paradoxus]|uniref:hypothetical protein n=1 Tax=Variovorax paradoxus TaxID=34073 RepID=UPI001ABCC8F1
MKAARRWLPWLLWPALYAAGLLAAAAAFASTAPLAWFNAAYLSLALAIALLERWLPHEPRWLADDGQMPCDLAHTLLTKGTAQVVAALAASLPLAGAMARRPSAHGTAW